MGNTQNKTSDNQITLNNVTDEQKNVFYRKLSKLISEKPVNLDGTLDICWMDFGDKGPLIPYSGQNYVFQQLRIFVQKELAKRFQHPFVLIDTVSNRNHNGDPVWWTMYPIVTQNKTDSQT